MGSSCLWRSSSTLCLSLPAPRRRALTPKPLWPLMAPASPRSSLRTPVKAVRWASVVLTTLTSQLHPGCENESCMVLDQDRLLLLLNYCGFSGPRGGQNGLQGIYRDWTGDGVLAFLCPLHSFKDLKKSMRGSNCWKGQTAREHTRVFGHEFSNE